MKGLFIVIFFVSCASYAPKTYKQNCAQKGMVLAGVTDSSSTTSFYSFNNNDTIYANSSGEAVTCVVPKNDLERCEIEVENQVLEPINEYNKSIGTKKLLNGLAYGLYIIPGIASKVYYDKARDRAIEESKDIRNSLVGSCSSTERVPASFRKAVPSRFETQNDKPSNISSPSTHIKGTPDNLLKRVDAVLNED